MTATIRPIEGRAALLAEPFTNPTAARWRYRSACEGDDWVASLHLALAAWTEWGKGDERTSEAIRLYILESDRSPYGPRRLACQVRHALIVAHRLDDMCPVHLIDARRDGSFPCCDEEDV